MKGYFPHRLGIHRLTPLYGILRGIASSARLAWRPSRNAAAPWLAMLLFVLLLCAADTGASLLAGERGKAPLLDRAASAVMRAGTVQSAMPEPPEKLDEGSGGIVGSALSTHTLNNPTLARIAILDTKEQSDRGTRIAILVGSRMRRGLETDTGMKIEVVNISRLEGYPAGQHGVIYYQPGYIHTALALAKAIPGEQTIEPMRQHRFAKPGVNLVIVVGAEQL